MINWIKNNVGLIGLLGLLGLIVLIPNRIGGSRTVIDGTTSGDTTYWDGNNWSPLTPSYGSLSEDTVGAETGSTITMTTQGTFYGWTGASSTISVQTGNTLVSSTIKTNATSTLTVGSAGAGVYMMGFSMTFFDSANQLVHCALFKNGTKYSRLSAESKISVAGDVVHLGSGPVSAPLVANDVIDLRCANETSGGKVLTIDHASVGIHRINK